LHAERERPNQVPLVQLVGEHFGSSGRGLGLASGLGEQSLASWAGELGLSCGLSELEFD